MKRSKRKLLRDYSITIAVAVSVALWVRSFVIEAYRVPSFAMKPTLISGDTVFVAKWPYRIQKIAQPQRGDVIVFTVPSEMGGSGSLNFIRRVLGLPGDQVLVRKGQVILNGKNLAHPDKLNSPCSREVLPEGKSYLVCQDSPIMEDLGPEIVPPGSIFVLGDQRTQPDLKKRKAWKIIPISTIKGQAIYTWLSIGTHPHSGGVLSWLPKFRLERMFRRIQ